MPVFMEVKRAFHQAVNPSRSLTAVIVLIGRKTQHDRTKISSK